MDLYGSNYSGTLPAAADSCCSDPKCPCHEHRKRCVPTGMECSLNRPLLMVIPPSGIHIQCPIHGKHFLIGTQVTC